MSEPRDAIGEAAKMYALRLAVGEFLMQFAHLETWSVTQVFRSLPIHDVDLLEHLEELMPLEGRIKLLKRVATGRKLAPELLKELIALLNEADELRLRRNEVAHGTAITNFVRHGGEQAGPIIGLQLPKSQRKSADVASLELKSLAESTVLSAAEIQTYSQATMDLQFHLSELSTKMDRARASANATN